MKKSNRFFVYAVCILLSIVLACSTLMVGAADAAESTTTTIPTESTTKEKPTGNDLIYTEPSIPTEPDITDTISQIVSENGWEDDLSEFGQDVSEASKEAESFFTKLIEKLEKAFESFIQFFKQIFRAGFFD